MRADDEMVDEVDVDETQRFLQFLRVPQVLLGRRRIARRMVVVHDDGRRCVIEERMADHVARRDERVVLR